jgi:hypothetical protein
MTDFDTLTALTATYGLSPKEARGFSSLLEAAVEAAGPALSEIERRGRAHRLTQINATLAIEGLALAPEERRFFAFVDELNLPEPRADELLDRYALARAHSIKPRTREAA